MSTRICIVLGIMSLLLGSLGHVAWAVPQYSGEVSQFTDLLAFSTGPSHQTLIVVFGEEPSEVDQAFSGAVEHLASFHFDVGAPGTIQVDALVEGLQIAVIAQTSLETLNSALLEEQLQTMLSATFQVGDLLVLRAPSGLIWTVEIALVESALAMMTEATGAPEPSVLVLLGVGLLGLRALKKWVRR